MAKINAYRGRGHDELYTYVDQHGTLVGEIVRNTGAHVASVEVSIDNGVLRLEVNGKEFSSITNALREMESVLAVSDAEGSEGSGNVANNVIGNYAILKHVVFGAVTMEDIVGLASPGTVRNKTSAKSRKPKTVKVTLDSSVLASGNLYNFFARDQILPIAHAHGGADGFQQYLAGKTVDQFANENGLVIA